MAGTYETLASRLRVKQLQLLIALDDLKSLHKASTSMHMTQSAASKALAELETMLDTKLFERTKTGLIPNEFGKAMIRSARALTSGLTSLCDEIIQIRSGTGGRLTVGAIMGAIPDLIAPAISELHETHPGLAIDIIEDTSTRMLSLLDEGRLDLVVGRASVSDQPEKYAYQALCGEPLSVVVGWHHPVRRQRKLALKDLKGYRWITYPSHLPLNELLDREMDLAGMRMPVNPIATSSAFVTIELLNTSSEFVSVIPTTVAASFARHQMLRILPITFKSASQTFGIVTRRDGSLSTAAKKLVQLLKDRASPEYACKVLTRRVKSQDSPP